MTLLQNPSHPGEVLAELYLTPLGMSTITLAKRLNVPRTRIERVVKGETALSVDTAMRPLEVLRHHRRVLDQPAAGARSRPGAGNRRPVRYHAADGHFGRTCGRLPCNGWMKTRLRRCIQLMGADGDAVVAGGAEELLETVVRYVQSAEAQLTLFTTSPCNARGQLARVSTRTR